MAPILAYWDIRGLGQAIRLLLHYCEEEFEDKLYSFGEAPEYKGESWFSVKYTLGLPFPNLPYYIDGDLKLTESKAILRHIGRRHDLLGNTADEMAEVDMLLDVCADRDVHTTKVFYSEDMESLKEELIQKTKEFFKLFEEFGSRRKNQKWFTGDNITVADFFLYEHIKRMTAFDATLINETDHKWLSGFIARFEDLPTLKPYMTSEEFIKLPFNGAMASWVGSAAI